MTPEKNISFIRNYKELEVTRCNKIWDLIHSQYWPFSDTDFSYKEPKGSLIISLEDLFKKYEDPEFETLIWEIDEYFLEIFKQITNQCIYAMDWQHTCYEINVHALDLQQYKKILIEENSFLYSKGANYYLLSVFPDGDYHMFFTEDMKQGILGHPWNQTLCIYGEGLLEAYEKERPQNLSKILRRN